MLAKLRCVLADANYSEAGISAALHRPNVEGGIPFVEVPVLLRRLEEASGDTLVTLIKLFSLGCPVPSADAARALRPFQLEDLSELLKSDADGRVSSPLRLTPYAGFIFAHDADGPPPLQPDYVMGIGPASRTLAGLTVRRPVERALDIGSGCGTQALLASRDAEQVFAVELNPRGVWLTQLNASLNRVDNLECRQGSLYEPVAGLDFDLIVSNPPYVISPDTTYVFRDSGRPGDSMCRTVVEQAAHALRDGAFAHVLCNWTHRRDQSWWEPLVDWVEECGCDAWLLHYQSQDGPAYAAQWHADVQSRNPAEYARTLDRWVAYYRRSGIELIASGAVILRRRANTSRNWIQWDEMPRAPVGTGGNHAGRVFAAYDALAQMTDDADLLASSFGLVDNHLLAQRLVYREGSYTVAETTMSLQPGIGLEGSIPAAVLPVLLRLDGKRPLGELVSQVANESSIPVDQLEAATVQTVRELFSRGLIDLTQARTR